MSRSHRSRALLATVLLFAASARSDERAEERERWIPALSIDTGLLSHGSNANATSGDIVGPPGPGGLVPGSPLMIQPSTSGESDQLAALLGASFELTAPLWLEALEPYGAPRLFAHVGAAHTFDSALDVTKDGIPGSFFAEPGQPLLEEATIQGQGSVVSSEWTPLLVSAGLGLSFTTTLADRTVRIKPSLAYISWKMKVQAEVARLVQLVPGNATMLSEFRGIRIRDRDDPRFHAIGPGLEIEVDAARREKVGLSVYLFGHAYSIVGSTDVNLSGRNPDEPGETANWNYEINRWGVRLQAGIRFRWLPE